MKTVVITGGTSGIGEALARRYLEKAQRPVIVNVAGPNVDAGRAPATCCCSPAAPAAPSQASSTRPPRPAARLAELTGAILRDV